MYVYGSGQSPDLQVAYFKRLDVLDGGHAFASHPHQHLPDSVPTQINEERISTKQ
jgi:hypothetical protein